METEYAEVFDYGKITEKSGIITDYWTNNLLDLILRRDNLNKTYKRVKANKGKGGIDGMQVDELLLFLRENQETIIQEINDGYVYVVDMDLEKFFDTVCQSKLIEVLSRTIKDGRLISLIHKYLNAGVIANGMFERTEIGMPQGGPLSPLLSNVMLNELDKELACSRKGYWRMANVLNSVLTNKIIAKLGYTSLLNYYLIVYEN